uniref:Deoxyribonuclease 1L3 n=1 Tax=Terrapene triunguis TaxID=2587831 RepID=A0A674J8H2_9SAUR
MFCISLFLLFFFNATLSIKICSFNVRSFGEAKRARPEVLDVIVKVISHCDIMLLMEIKDNSNKICPLLIEKLNGQYQEEYDYVISTRLGRKSYKEQYAFIYRSNVVSVKGTYQYPDIQPGDVDAFSREPFVNFIFMGDFNAGCGYVPKKHWKNIRLKTHSEFVWLIGDKNDTTVRNSTNCAYDRIVIHGEKLINAVVPNSADIIDFQRAFGMTEEQALEVSDHFPVVFELKTTRGFLNGPRSLAAKKRKTRTLYHLSS